MNNFIFKIGHKVHCPLEDKDEHKVNVHQELAGPFFLLPQGSQRISRQSDSLCLSSHSDWNLEGVGETGRVHAICMYVEVPTNNTDMLQTRGLNRGFAWVLVESWIKKEIQEARKQGFTWALLSKPVDTRDRATAPEAASALQGAQRQ